MNRSNLIKSIASVVVLYLIFLAIPQNVSAETKIVHWQHTSSARDNMMRTLAAEFMAANPGVTIEIEVFPLAEYLNKVQVSLAGGVGPDTMQVRANWVPWLTASGMLQPLSETVLPPAQIEEEFVPGPLSQLKGNDGRYYGLPTDAQTIVLFYQPGLFDLVGLDSTRPPSTWDEAIEAARRITRRGPGGETERMGLATGGFEPVLISLMLQAGAELWDQDNNTPTFAGPEAARGLQFATDLVTIYGVEDLGFGSRWTAFRNETLGMVYAHPAMMGSFWSTHPDLEFGIIEIPPAEAGGSQESLITTWGLTITNQADNVDMATRWLLYVQSAESQRRWFELTGELPTRLDVIRLPEYQQNPLYAPITWSMVRSVAQPWISDQVAPSVRAAWRSIIDGTAPASALETMQLTATNAERQTRESR